MKSPLSILSKIRAAFNKSKPIVIEAPKDDAPMESNDRFDSIVAINKMKNGEIVGYEGPHVQMYTWIDKDGILCGFVFNTLGLFDGYKKWEYQTYSDFIAQFCNVEFTTIHGKEYLRAEAEEESWA